MVTYHSNVLIGGIKGGTEMAVPPDETELLVSVLPPVTWHAGVEDEPPPRTVDWRDYHYRRQTMSYGDSDVTLEFFVDAKLDPDQACAAMWEHLVQHNAYPKP